MLILNDDLSIYCTRGDCGEISINARINGEPSVFRAGDVLRLKVFEKKGCDTVVMQRDFTIEEEADSLVISLNAADTKIGKVISKPVDYWYEVELNPDTNPQTIIGYDEDGPKVFKLFPEGKDVDGEDIAVVGPKTLKELVDYTLEQAKESGDFKGETGVGIESITFAVSEEDSGENIITFKLTNGEEFYLTVRNGGKGEPGNATDIGLEAGEAEYSVKQSRHPDSSQNHAYQRGGVALGGNTQAGVTEEEYNASDKYKQWDGTKFLEFLETFGFQLAWGDGSKARGRNSMAGNEGCEANAKNSTALGLKVIVDFLNGFGAGQYNENLPDSLVEFGCGNSGWKQNGFAMDTTGTIKTRTVRPKASGSFDLGASNFVWRYVYAFYIKAQSSIETPLVTATKAKVTTAPTEDNDVVRLIDLPDVGLEAGTGNNATQQASTTASGEYSFAKGYKSKASGSKSSAEGSAGEAAGEASHVEGLRTIATGQGAHAEGCSSGYLSDYANANEAAKSGNFTAATGVGSHAEGYNTVASGAYSHTEGKYTRSSAENAHAEGYNTTASGQNSHAEGGSTTASFDNSHAEGSNTTASANGAHAEGTDSNASGIAAHAEGGSTQAINDYTHAEGFFTSAGGQGSHAEGWYARANGDYSHAEGYEAVASGKNTHAEGCQTQATNDHAHAEGNETTASGTESHAEGYNTTASGKQSHAEGASTTASHDRAHAEGYGTRTSRTDQHVEGRWNKDEPTAFHITGCGAGDTDLDNCFTSGVTEDVEKYIKVGDTMLTEAQLIKLLALIG